jgi:hypothetical protein
MHLLIPFANCNAPECQQALAALKLPNLDKLLRRLPLTHTDAADETTLSPPHERALAAAFGITAADGQIPFGAHHAAQVGKNVQPADAWAVITPCHWAVQTAHITMTHPRALNLGEEESRALLAAMQPYFAEDGIALMYDTPTRWLAQGEVFAGLATASPYRVVGGHVDDWLPKAASAKLLRRLQNEMQMLLYTHPLTDARAARGVAAVNSFWVSGTGVLPAGFAHTTTATATPAPVIVPNTLRDAAVCGDWAAWALAWQQIDNNECAALLKATDTKAGTPADPRSDATLTLCGERNAKTWHLGLHGSQNGLTRRLMQALRGQFRTFPTSYIISLL